MNESTPDQTPQVNPNQSVSKAVWRFVLQTVNIRTGADIKGTIEGIEKRHRLQRGLISGF